MKYNKFILFALGAMALAGCQKGEEEIVEEKPDVVQPETATWTLTVRAERNDGPLTRGLAMDGDKAKATALQSIWKTGEEVKVYLGTACIGTRTATPDGTDAHLATLSGEITTSGITPGETTLTLLTPRDSWDYAGQDGTLLDTDNSIEKKYHYTMASSVRVTGVSGSAITAEEAHFINQQSIYRFSFRYINGSTKTSISTRSVTISAAGGHLVQSQVLGGSTVEGPISVIRSEADTNPFFVALRNGDEQNDEVYTFTVVDGTGVTYRGTKEIPADYKTNGTFVSVKNATLDQRLDLSLSATEVTTAL